MSAVRRFSLAAAAAVILLAPWARAQTAQVVSGMGLHRAVFRVPAGTIRLNLPGDMTAGDHVTGTVYTEPSGRNQREQDNNAKQLAAYTLAVGGDAGFEGNRLSWSLPRNLTPQSALIQLRDRSGKTVASCELPVLPGPADIPAFSAPPAILLPTGGPAGGFLSVWGTFGSAAVSARVGDIPADLIAQSPRKAVLLTSPKTAGATTLEVSAGAISAKSAFRALGLVVTAATRNLMRGQTTMLTVTVSGLAGLTSPADLVVRNVTPEIAAMDGGALQTFSIAPSDVRPDGTYLVSRRLVAVQDGAFDISATVIRPPMSLIPAEALVRRTIARWSRRNGIAITGDARELMWQGVEAARPQLDAFLRAQIAFGADPGDLLSSLVSEYCFVLRNGLLNPAFGALRPMPLPRLARGFQNFRPAPVTIQGDTVQKRPFLQFLGDVLRRYTPSGGWGSILVSSQPPQQPFTVDQAGGITAQTFSATAGPHSVKVGSCQKQVQVVANQTAVVNCVLR